jgi:hypothetical protein
MLILKGLVVDITLIADWSIRPVRPPDSVAIRVGSDPAERETAGLRPALHLLSKARLGFCEESEKSTARMRLAVALRPKST